MCNLFSRINNSFRWICNSFPLIKQSVLLDCNSFSQIAIWSLEIENLFSRIEIRSLKLENCNLREGIAIRKNDISVHEFLTIWRDFITNVRILFKKNRKSLWYYLSCGRIWRLRHCVFCFLVIQWSWIFLQNVFFFQYIKQIVRNKRPYKLWPCWIYIQV